MANVESYFSYFYNEAYVNLRRIKLAEEGYKLGNGTYLNCAASPRTVENLDETAVPWQDLGGFTDIYFFPSSTPLPENIRKNIRFNRRKTLLPTILALFRIILFDKQHKVRYIYQVSYATETSFVAEALGDTDGDGNRILFVATELESPRVVGPSDADLTLTLGTHYDTDD